MLVNKVLRIYTLEYNAAVKTSEIKNEKIIWSDKWHFKDEFYDVGENEEVWEPWRRWEQGN